MTHAPLDFAHGAILAVIRPLTGPTHDKLGDRLPTERTHTVGPCSIVDSHGSLNYADDGTARWIGTITVEAPPDSDVRAADRMRLPDGTAAIVTSPPVRPRNPFTGWTPYITFILAAPGTAPALDMEG